MSNLTPVDAKGLEDVPIRVVREMMRGMEAEIELLLARNHDLKVKFSNVLGFLDATTMDRTADRSRNDTQAFRCNCAEQPSTVTITTRLRPTQAVLMAIREEQGLTPTQVADKMANRVDSRAKDRRNVLRTTAHKLVSDGVLRRYENRLYWNKEHEIEDEMHSMNCE